MQGKNDQKLEYLLINTRRTSYKS